MKLSKRVLALTLVVVLICGFAFAGQGNNNGFEVGKLTGKSAEAKEAIALKFMEKKSTNDFKVKNKYTDQLGLTTVRVQQYYNNVPVFGSDQIVNIAEDGVVKSFIGKVAKLEDKLSKNMNDKVSKKEAVELAKNDLGFTPEIVDAPKADIVVYMDGETPHYAYQVELVFDAPQPGYWNYFIEVATGDVLFKFNEIDSYGKGGTKPPKKPRPGDDSNYDPANTVTGTGTDVLGNTQTITANHHTDGTYYLADMTKGNGVFTYDAGYSTSLPGSVWSDSDNVYNASYDAPAVSSQNYMGITYDYYMNKFNRNSFDGNGAAVKSSVHVGSSYNNAYWNGSQFAFGDGDGYVFIPLSGAIDVVAHEFTHAVTSYTADLVYAYESGAINEAMSDIFGTAVEFYANEDPDWLCGEDIAGPGLGAVALRSLANPPLCGDPDHVDDMYLGSSDNGGVHSNSGIYNKVAYLIGNGGNHNGINVSGQGVEVMEKVFYRALTVYMTSSTNFVQGRTACVQAAADLYGASSAQVTAVENAFTSVGIN